MAKDSGNVWEFPGGPVVRTLCSDCRGLGSIDPGTKILCGAPKKTKEINGNAFSHRLGGQNSEIEVLGGPSSPRRLWGESSLTSYRFRQLQTFFLLRPRDSKLGLTLH